MATHYKNKTIDTSKLAELTPGTVLQNYRVLCELLNEPVKTGCKQLQLDQWALYFDFEQIPHSHNYKINRVYTPEEVQRNKATYEIEHLSSSHSIYTNHITQLLLTDLAAHDNYSSYTTAQLFSLLGFVNNNYKNKEMREELVQELQLIDGKAYHIEFVMNATYTRMQQILNSTLHSLTRTKIINYRSVLLVRSNNVTRYATLQEEAYIDELSQVALSNTGCVHLYQVFQNHRIHDYYDEYNQLLRSELGLEWASNELEIEYNEAYREQTKHMILNAEQYNVAKQELNQLIMNALHRALDAKLKSYQAYNAQFGRKIGSNENDLARTYFYLPKHYPDNYEEICNVILDKFFKL